MRLSLCFSVSEDPIPLDIGPDFADTKGIKELTEEARKQLISHGTMSETREFFLVWGGRLFTEKDDGCSISSMQLFEGAQIHVVFPVTSFLRNKSDAECWLPKFFNLQGDYPMQCEQHDDRTLRDALTSFFEWVKTTEAKHIWSPGREALQKFDDALLEMQSNKPGFLGSRHVKFYGGYGCALVASVLSADDTVFLKLLCLDGWEMRVHCDSSCPTTYASSPDIGRTKELDVGTVNSSDYDQFLKNTDYLIRKAQARRGGSRRGDGSGEGRGNQKTPAFIESVMLDAIEVAHIDLSSNANELEGVQAETLPRGAFTDVGPHTGGSIRNTMWPLLQAVLRDFVKEEPCLFQEAVRQFRLRLVESLVAFVQDDAISFSEDKIRSLLNGVMHALQEVVDDCSEGCRCFGEKSIHYIEARVMCVRHEMEVARLEAAKAAAKQSELVKSETIGVESVNFKQFRDWITGNALKNQADEVESTFLITRLVEAFFFLRVATLSSDNGQRASGESGVRDECKYIEEIMDEYRRAVSRLPKDEPRRVRMLVDLRSRELLVLWSGFCLVYKRVSSCHQILHNYRPALDPDDLQFLTLSDKIATDALKCVVTYLRRCTATSRYPCFSLRANDGTFDLAREYARQHLMDKLDTEYMRAQNRHDEHWRKVCAKKARLLGLDEQLRASVRELKDWERQFNSTERQRSGWNATSDDNDRRRQEAEHQMQRISDRISSQKQEIRNVEQPPAPIRQPLPRDKDWALPIVFFLLMPKEFQVLSRLSFVAQQMLLPPGDSKEASLKLTHPEPGQLQALDVSGIIRRSPPQTTWRQYYRSTARSFFAVENAVTLGSDAEVPTMKVPPTVRQYGSRETGVWYPDSLKPGLFWGDNVPEIDRRVEGSFDPFSRLRPRGLVFMFTEKLNKPFDDLQWAVEQHGAGQASSSRQNWGEATQDINRETRLFTGKCEYLAFCGLRAYPYQQIRKLCVVLKEKTLPLTEDSIRVTILQTLCHIGPLTMEGAQRDWRVDSGAVDALHHELEIMAEEIVGKKREHKALLALGLVAAHLADFHVGCHRVSRKFAGIARQWADSMKQEQEVAKMEDVPALRARRCRFYMYSIVCYGGDLDHGDIAALCELSLLAESCRIFENKIAAEDEVKALTLLTNDFLSKRCHSLIQEVQPSMLSEAANLIVQEKFESWSRVKVPGQFCSTACFEATSLCGDHLLSVNVVTGTLLYDGLPPQRLPASMVRSSVYKRTFSDHNFDVIKRGSVLQTTRPINGKIYSFEDSKAGLIICEQNQVGSEPVILELMDGTEEGVESWGQKFPPRLSRMYSHWLCRERTFLLLRPLFYTDREIHYILKRDDCTSRWNCHRVPIQLRQADIGELLSRSSEFDELNSMEQDQSQVLAVLRRFEDKCFIDCYRESKGMITFEFPRYGLVFELAKDGTLWSRNFKGYCLCKMQKFLDTLHGFEQYLVLDSECPTLPSKVIIPRGAIVRGPNSIFVSRSEACDENLEYLVYEVHHRFQTISPPAGKNAVEARLQLACLHAANLSSIPESRSMQTSGERAVELIRQSSVNRPLTPNELRHIEFLHTGAMELPTISLVSSCVQTASRELYFLYAGSTQELEIPRRNIDGTNYKLLKRQGRINLGITHPAQCFEKGFKPRGIQRSSEEIEKELRRQIRSRELNVVEKPFPFDTKVNESDGTIAEKVWEDLMHSWKHSQAESGSFLLENRDFSCYLDSLYKACRHARSASEAEILQFVSHVPIHESPLAPLFGMRRAVNLEPIATIRDLVIGARSTDHLRNLNPFLPDDWIQSLQAEILQLLKLCVLEDKLERMNKMTKESDTFELQREFSNIGRAWAVKKFPCWLALEVEQRMQIRDIQYKVADFCMNNPSKITQLNMGEGKTRVILPMLMLALAKPARLVRLHFLSSLLSEAYDYLHYVFTGSLFNRKLVLLPFHRYVNPTAKQAMVLEHSLLRCQRLLGAVCVAREHRLSLDLKHVNGCKDAAAQKCLERIDNLPYLDIHDESDENFHHRYQLIFAIGPCIPLPELLSRLVAVQACLREIQSNDDVKRIVRQEGVATWSPNQSNAFDCITLYEGEMMDKARQPFQEAVVNGILARPPYEMRWLEDHPDVRQITDFLISQNRDRKWLEESCPALERGHVHQLLALRGMLAYRVLEHCLCRRFNVDYGIDPRRHERRIAVPYRACDCPDDRSEFAHNDTAILLTHLSYYYRGLSKGEVVEAVKTLLHSNPVAREKEYKVWLSRGFPTSVSEADRVQVDDVNKLDPTNSLQVAILYGVFNHNMETINFFLAKCVLPLEAMQFPQRLIANACHLAHNETRDIIGFSGTKDNYLLLPPQVDQTIPSIPLLQATDGKMLKLILQNEEVECLGADQTQNEVLRLAVDNQANAIIDSGAIMAGLSNEKVARHMVELIRTNQVSRFEGVIFFHKEMDTWAVLEKDGRPPRPLDSSPLTEAEAIVFFDEMRCRGADKKLPPNACAYLTVSKGMTKDKLMQAAGRMRKLDRGQTLKFLIPNAVAQKIRSDLKGSFVFEERISTKVLLQWIIRNTIASITSAMPQWAQSASYFATTLGNNEARKIPERLSLEEMYGDAVEADNMACAISQVIQTDRERAVNFGVEVNEAILTKVEGRITEFCSDQPVLVSTDNDECERELENERELEKEVERIIPRQTPIHVVEWDIAALLDATNPADVPSQAGVMKLSDAIRLRHRNLASIQWDFGGPIFVTANFVESVCSQEGQHIDDMTEFMRPVDAVALFGDEKNASACLLLSEWETDGVLRLLSNEASLKPNCSISLANLAYVRETADLEWKGPCTLQIPSKFCRRRVSEAMLASLQLLSGDTMFASPGRQDALRQLLPTAEAKIAAKDLVASRGRGNFLERSDLERVCGLDMVGEIRRS